MNNGSERLLRDCDLVGRMIEADRRPARMRLAAALGPELAARLLGQREGPLDEGPFWPQVDPPRSRGH